MREATESGGNRIDVHEPTWRSGALPDQHPGRILGIVVLLSGAVAGWLSLAVWLIRWIVGK